MLKKMLSALLAVLLLMSLSVTFASAQDGAVLEDITVTIDTGAQVTLTDADNDTYYDIGTADALYAFAAAVNGGRLTINGELTDDIVVNEGVMDYYSKDARVWTPIGAVDEKPLDYTGNFNGNEKTVSGLYFNDLYWDYVGLFGYSKGIIRNVGITNSFFYGRHYVGAVAGKSENAIYDCYNDSTVRGGYYVGGIAGMCSVISSCRNYGILKVLDYALDLDEEGNVNDSYFLTGSVGGIVGHLNRELLHCENYGTIDSNAYGCSGGVVGSADGYIEEAVNYADVCGNYSVGGIVGMINNGVYDTENYGDIRGFWFTGGIVGESRGWSSMNTCENYGNVKGRYYTGGIAGDACYAVHVYNYGDVEGEEYTGGVIGYANYSSRVIEVKNTGSIKGENYTGGICGAINGYITVVRNEGDTVIGDNYVGGIVGFCENTFTNDILRCSYNYADITGRDYVGGIAGDSDEDIAHVYNKGAVTGENFVGGLAGSQMYYTIRNSLNVGSVTGENYVGGVAGELDLENMLISADSSSEIKVFYLDGCAENTDGEDQGGAGAFYSYTDEGGMIENDECSYLTAATEEELASGEITYILYEPQPEEEGVPWEWFEWSQNIDSGDTPDEYPFLDGGRMVVRVYGVENCIGEIVSYSNKENEAKVHDYNDTGVCKDCYALKEGEIAGVAGHSLSLADALELNYYVAVDDKVFEDEDAKVIFTVGEGDKARTVEKPLNEALTPAAYVSTSSNLYLLTCDVTAIEMTANITAKLISKGVETEFAQYSVMDYAEAILASPDKYEKEIPLVKAMLVYGANAQLHFGYSTDNLANKNLTEEDKVLNEVDLSAYKPVITGKETGVRNHGVSLTLNSETELNIFFSIEDEENIPKFMVNGETSVPVKVGEYYRIKIADIPAHNLDKEYVITVGGLTARYSAMSYGYMAMYTQSETVRNVVRALYAYNQAAVSYNS